MLKERPRLPDLPLGNGPRSPRRPARWGPAAAPLLLGTLGTWHSHVTWSPLTAALLCKVSGLYS